MPGNAAPIFTRVGDIQGGTLFTTGINEYSGTNVLSLPVFSADDTNGGFVQRLRFKAGNANNVATVARVFINQSGLSLNSQLTAPGTVTGTPSASGGSLNTGTWFARAQAVDQLGGLTTTSTSESASVTTVGPAASITWTWPVSLGANSYRLYVGLGAGNQRVYFTTTTNTLTQTVSVITGQRGAQQDFVNNMIFYGEVSLPATTAVANAATVDVDYPMNVALPPGYRVFVQLGTTVSGGWYVSGIGGKY